MFSFQFNIFRFENERCHFPIISFKVLHADLAIVCNKLSLDNKMLQWPYKSVTIYVSHRRNLNFNSNLNTNFQAMLVLLVRIGNH